MEKYNPDFYNKACWQRIVGLVVAYNTGRLAHIYTPYVILSLNAVVVVFESVHLTNGRGTHSDWILTCQWCEVGFTVFYVCEVSETFPTNLEILKS